MEGKCLHDGARQERSEKEEHWIGDSVTHCSRTLAQKHGSSRRSSRVVEGSCTGLILDKHLKDNNSDRRPRRSIESSRKPLSKRHRNRLPPPFKLFLSSNFLRRIQPCQTCAAITKVFFFPALRVSQHDEMRVQEGTTYHIKDQTAASPVFHLIQGFSPADVTAFSYVAVKNPHPGAAINSN